MKHISIVLAFLLCVSCNDNTDLKSCSELQTKIERLEIENKRLKDSLSGQLESYLLSQRVIGIPDDLVQKVGKRNNIKFIFHDAISEIPEYEIFLLDINGKETKIGKSTKTMFEYEFTPKSIDDKDLRLRVEIPFKNRKIEIPVRMNLTVEN